MFEFRKEIADILRKKSRQSDDDYNDGPVIPMKRRKKVAIKLGKTQRKKKKKYSLYEDFEDE